MNKIVPVYPWPMHPQIAEALSHIAGIDPVEALPGGPGPVVAIRKAPPFVCDAIVVDVPMRLAEAVNIAISDGIKLVTVRDMISEAFGAPVKELLVKREGPKFQ